MIKIREYVHQGFVAIDGDDVGIILRARIVSNDIEGASLLSSEIHNYFNNIRQKLESEGFQIVFCGGDSVLVFCETSISSAWFTELPIDPCTISVGIGKTPEYAYLALQLAKARGKNQIVLIDSIDAKTIHGW